MTLIVITSLLIIFTLSLMWALAACDSPTSRTTMGIKLPKDTQ